MNCEYIFSIPSLLELRISICPATLKTQLAFFAKVPNWPHLLWSVMWNPAPVLKRPLTDLTATIIEQCFNPSQVVYISSVEETTFGNLPLKAANHPKFITYDFESPNNKFKPYPITLSDWGVQSPQQRYIRCHYHSQKVIGSRGKVHKDSLLKGGMTVPNTKTFRPWQIYCTRYTYIHSGMILHSYFKTKPTKKIPEISSRSIPNFVSSKGTVNGQFFISLAPKSFEKFSSDMLPKNRCWAIWQWVVHILFFDVFLGF